MSARAAHLLLEIRLGADVHDSRRPEVAAAAERVVETSGGRAHRHVRQS